MTDEFVPQTEAGKKALADGADAEVVKSMEEDGSYSDEGDTKEPEKKPEHVEKKDDDEAGDGGDGKAPDGKKEDGDEVVEPEGPNRRVEHVPAWRAKEDSKKARDEGIAEGKKLAEEEFNKKIAEAGNRPGGANADDVKSIAEEFGLREDLVPAFIERIGGIVAQKVKVDLKPEDRAILESARNREQREKEIEGFNNEWADAVTRDALTAAAGGKEITEDVKNKVKELAYSSTYHRYRLSDIIRLEAPQLFPKGSKSAEHGRGGTDRGGQTAKTIDSMSPEDVMNLSDKEFEELSDSMAKGQSRFTRTEVPKKPKT